MRDGVMLLQAWLWNNKESVSTYLNQLKVFTNKWRKCVQLALFFIKILWFCDVKLISNTYIHKNFLQFFQIPFLFEVTQS